MLDRKQGWLNGLFYYRFREILTHTAFRYAIACPIFCLMPDHFHMVWMGLSDESDQLLAMNILEKPRTRPFAELVTNFRTKHTITYYAATKDKMRHFMTFANTSQEIRKERA